MLKTTPHITTVSLYQAVLEISPWVLVSEKAHTALVNCHPLNVPVLAGDNEVDHIAMITAYLPGEATTKRGGEVSESQ